MLLSSIAMLLVALVALGSASFAWYKTQTSVTAEEAAVGAALADGLEIRKDSANYPDTEDYGAWGTSIELNDAPAGGLAPATMTYADDLTNNKYGVGGVGTSYSDGTLTSGLTEAANMSAFTVTRFQVAKSGTAATYASWQIDHVVVPAGTTYMAFVVYKDGQKVGSWTSGSNTTKKAKYESSTLSEDTTAFSHTGTLVNDTNITTGLSNFVVGSKDSPTTFVVIGFADGFDQNCTSKNAKNDQVKISFTFNKANSL